MKAFYKWCYMLWGGGLSKDFPLKRKLHNCYSANDQNI